MAVIAYLTIFFCVIGALIGLLLIVHGLTGRSWNELVRMIHRPRLPSDSHLSDDALR